MSLWCGTRSASMGNWPVVTTESRAGRDPAIDNEHPAELLALRRLLSGNHYQHAADIGGGFGRFPAVLTEYADRVTLVDPSTQQLDLSREIFPGQPFERRLAEAAKLPFDDGSIDLAIMVRVLHHLPDPANELAELARVLRPGGHAVVEAANSAHARRRGSAPYVNHHPRTITRQLAAVGLEVLETLSASSFRPPLADLLVPQRVLLAAERAVQRPLAAIHFGPSVFLMLEKRPTVPAPSRGPPPVRVDVPAYDAQPVDSATYRRDDGCA